MQKLILHLTLGLCLASVSKAQTASESLCSGDLLYIDHGDGIQEPWAVRSDPETGQQIIVPLAPGVRSTEDVSNPGKTRQKFFRRRIATNRRDEPKLPGRAHSHDEIGSLPLTISGYISAIAIQEDGKIVIGGVFNIVNGIPRSNIARLNPDGSVDETWNPGADWFIRVIAVSGGSVYVGGDFRSIGGQSRKGLAKISLSGTGAADPSWNPNPDIGSGGINAIAISGANLYVAGDFRVIGGQRIAKLAKIDAEGSGAADPNWNPNPLAVTVQSSVFALAVHGTNIFVGGSFSYIGGLERKVIAKLDGTGTGAADPYWSANVSGGFPSWIGALAVDGTNLFAGGSFTRVNGVIRTNLAKLSTSSAGELDMVWNPNAVGPISGGDSLGNVTAGTVYKLIVSGTDLYVSGSLYSVGGLMRNNFAKVRADGAGQIDSKCAPPRGIGFFGAFATTGDSIYAPGMIESPNGLRLNVAKLDSQTGTPDESFSVQAGFPGRVNAIARQLNGELIFGGSFDAVGTFARNNLAKANADGTVDLSWAPDLQGEVRTIAVDGSQVFVGGNFWGRRNQWLAKIDSLGRGNVDSEWNASFYSFDPYYFFNEGIRSLLIDGTNLFVGGSFDYVLSHSITNWVPRPGVAKFSTAGAGQVDGLWTAESLLTFSSFGGGVHTLELSGTTLFVGGQGLFFGDFADNRFGVNLAKLSTLDSGQVDINWRPNPTYAVSSLAVRGNDLFVGGWFDSIGGASRTNLAKVSTQGAGEADPVWRPNIAIDPTRYGCFSYYPVAAMALHGNSLFVGGNFTSVGGVSRNNIAKLMITGAGEVDPTWQQEVDSSVNSLFTAGSKVYVAGCFTSIGELSRYGFALINIADGPEDRSARRNHPGR